MHNPPVILGLAELRRLLNLSEGDLAAGCLAAPDQLRSLIPSVQHWAHRLRQTHLIRRLAHLLRSAGDAASVVSLLETAQEIDPDDVRVVASLSVALETAGEMPRALAVLESGLLRKRDLVLLGRAASLAKKLGDQDRSLALRREAASEDPKHRALLIGELVAADRAAEALAEARAAINSGPLDPELAFRCYIALRRYSAESAEADQAYGLLMESAQSSSERHLWAARVNRREGRFDKALADISIAVDLNPEDAALRRERAVMALDCGHWGRDAAIILDGLSESHSIPAEVHEKVRQAEGLLHAFGTSLREAASDPKRCEHIRSPDSVFIHVAKTTPPPIYDRNGIVMIGWSLAAGGAERILATCFNQVRNDPRFGWAKLYLLELSSDRGRDFYLTEAGIERSEVVLIDRNRSPEPPLSWLPAWRGRQAQGIYEQLQRDRPAIVHSWNEPLNVLASLAGVLAGVPRIVLHTHNMRPTELNPDDEFAPYLRECYRALLTRPEVMVVTCAEAATQDYAQWLDVTESSKFRTLYNGMDIDSIDRAGTATDRASLRAELGLPADVPVIGTAFRFSEVKRPMRWIEAAALVADESPECRFVMFGDGVLHQAAEEEIARRGLAGRFVLPGLVRDLYRRLPGLDLFALSSRAEALPNVLIEAQAAGVPVVAYDVGGVRETFLDGITGILVKDDSPKGLASAMLRALGDQTWRRAASSFGPVFVKDRFSLDRMVNSLTRLLLSEPV